MEQKFSPLLDSDKHADFTIKCDDYSFHVKKSIISVSGFFARICDSPFREGLSATVELPDEDSAVVARAILFMYGGTYPTTNVAADPRHPECDEFISIDDPFQDESFEHSDYFLHRLCLHTFMYAFGDRYDIPKLKDYSRYRFLLALTGNDEHDLNEETGWDEDQLDGTLNGEDDALWEELAPIIKLVYSSTPAGDRGLRNIVVQWISIRLLLTSLSKTIEISTFQQLLKDLPELQWDVITMPLAIRDFRCISCQTNCQSDDGVLNIAQRCRCGKIGSCRKRQCAEAAMKDTFCMVCLSLDCVMLEDEELDDDPVPGQEAVKEHDKDSERISGDLHLQAGLST